MQHGYQLQCRAIAADLTLRGAEKEVCGLRDAAGCLPALVGLDLLLDVLPVGALSSLLGHGHQLDQLRPGGKEEGLVAALGWRPPILSLPEQREKLNSQS